MDGINKYFLESTEDLSDRSAEIEANLAELGTCILGAGDFYVSGIKMPAGTSLMGLGKATRIILLPEIESGAAVEMNSYTEVKDMCIMGSCADIELPEKVGSRHGITFIGTATETDYSGQLKNSIITGCHIRAFTGGGITCTDTGYSTSASITATNCHIMNCGAGINITHFSEYHEFTNILSSQNLYGCINNGGNNCFVNCGFDSNTTAFLIDNSHGQSINDSHGSAVGCSFNHSGKNEGIGIQILGAKNGYIFTGCQIFYSKVVLEEAAGVVISSTNFGRAENIIVKGGGTVLLSDCVFGTPPVTEIENNDFVKITNCFTRQGEAI